MRLLALLALVAALVAGCAANETVGVEQLSAAAQRTVETGSSRVELTASRGEDSATVEGVVDYEAGEAQLAFSGTSEGEDRKGELRIVDGTVYVRVPRGLGGLGLLTEKPWLALPLPKEGQDSLEDLGFPFPTVDPEELIRTLEDVAGEVTGLGEEDVRGAAAEGYRVELDLARLGHGEGTVPAEIWIDEDDRVRRVTLAHEDVEATVDFFDFGADADVQAPAKDQVLDVMDIWKSAGWTPYAPLDPAEPKKEND